MERVKLTDEAVGLMNALWHYTPHNTELACCQNADGLVVWATDRHFIFMVRYGGACTELEVGRDYQVVVTGKNIWADPSIKVNYRFDSVMKLFHQAADSSCETPQAVSPEHMAVMDRWMGKIADESAITFHSTYCNRSPYGLLLTGEIDSPRHIQMAFLCSHVVNERWGKDAKACKQALICFDPPF